MYKATTYFRQYLFLYGYETIITKTSSVIVSPFKLSFNRR